MDCITVDCITVDYITVDCITVGFIVMEIERSPQPAAEVLAELEQLRHDVKRLTQANSDLEISLLTTAEHGDCIQAQLQTANQRLEAEIAERQLAQLTLQTILETVSNDKADLEMILMTTAEHGDVLEYQLYTQAVETMRQSEELFRAISESTPILMILTQQLDGKITYANSISIQQLGLDLQRPEGYRLQEFFLNPGDELQIRSILAEQGRVCNYEMQVRCVSGDAFWVSASIHPLVLGDSQTLLTTLYDISDRKRAEAALQQSQDILQQQAQDLEQRVLQRAKELQQAEEKYRTIFENAAEGIFQTTPQGSYLSANPALANLYGYDSPDELMGHITNMSQQIYVQPRRRDEMMAYLTQFGSVEGFESEVYRKDGSTIWVSENVRAVRDADHVVLYYEGSMRDITDRKTAEDELRQQRLMSERLLLNVLPQPIAERLKRGETNIADSFPAATVLFADIVNFTGLSSHIAPVELVGLLNRVFSVFDKLADRYQLEKIKTIGDAYMVVGGVPTAMPDHVEAIAAMALGMMRATNRFKTRNKQTIRLRIGIHTGPVVAGVIGSRKFTYDLWGDTVNVASRMESQGELGRIQVSEAVYEKLGDRFTFAPRQPIEIKGKGLMNTYWLLGKKSE